MMRSRHILLPLVSVCLIVPLIGSYASAAKVTVDLGPKATGVSMVGAFDRWDIDGNANRPVNPKAKIDQPEVVATATDTGEGKWIFKDLKPGTYDLVILREGRIRIEGFTYPPVLEFDPTFPADATCDEEAAEFIIDDIKKARHYENKVEPLHLGGHDKAIRILVMLIRDQKTSYEGHLAGAATMRFEVWQYDWRYGGWAKNKRTKVLHRVMLTRSELCKNTWLFDGKLGGIKVKDEPVRLEYTLPKLDERKLKGLYPYSS